MSLNISLKAYFADVVMVRILGFSLDLDTIFTPVAASMRGFQPDEIDRIIEMAWEDRTTFDAIQAQYGLSESEVIAVMRTELKPSTFRMWRKRVTGRKTKHGFTTASQRFRAACHR